MGKSIHLSFLISEDTKFSVFYSNLYSSLFHHFFKRVKTINKDDVSLMSQKQIKYSADVFSINILIKFKQKNT